MMDEKMLLKALGDVDESFIEEADPSGSCGKSKKTAKILCAAAAAAVTVTAALLLQSGLISLGGRETVILQNGEEIVFSKGGDFSSFSLADSNVSVRELSSEECSKILNGLPFEGTARFSSEGEHEIFGIDGKINDVKISAWRTDDMYMDTVIVGSEKKSQVDGISVTAGYFESMPNSRGEVTVIYYASFKIGETSFYLENAGDKKDGESIREKLAEALSEIIEKGEPDFSAVKY